VALLPVALVCIAPAGARGAPTVSTNYDSLGVNVAAPIVEGFRIMVDVPLSEELQIVRLLLDDTALAEPGFDARDTEVILYYGGATPTPTSRDISVTTYQVRSPYRLYNRTVLSFDLPLWKPGYNWIRIEAETEHSTGLRVILFDLQVEEDFGQYRDPVDGGLYMGRLGLPGIAMWQADCTFVFCKDADGDGLLDLWENLAVELLRPVLVHDVDEELFDHPDNDHVRVFVRVTPVYQAIDPLGTVEIDQVKIIFKHMIAYTRDYGWSDWWDHNGDVAKLTTVWHAGNEEIILQWGWTNGHPCRDSFCSGRDPRPHMFYPNDIGRNSDGEMLIAVEENKHGTWASVERCQSRSAYDCSGPFHEIRPAAVNVGEPLYGLAPGGWPFLDRLSATWALGPFAGLRENGILVFPYEAVWSDPDGRFCGGRECEDGSPQSIGNYLQFNSGTDAQFSFARREGDPPRAVWFPNAIRTSCGLGAELAVLMPLAMWLYRPKRQAKL
jgi:hypothetical protein